MERAENSYSRKSDRPHKLNIKQSKPLQRAREKKKKRKKTAEWWYHK